MLRYLILLILLFQVEKAICQELSIPRIPQRASQLCWAASMEMILKYHGSSKTQCDLIKYHYLIEDEGETSPEFEERCESWCNSLSDPVSTDDDEEEDCNRTLETFDGWNTQNFDIVFSKLIYYSVEDNLKMYWGNVKKQINSCRPFIAIVNGTGTVAGNHAVVVKGYRELLSGQKKVVVNDPWTNETHLLDEIILDREGMSRRYFINANSFVHDIHKRGDDLCTSCVGGRSVMYPTTSLSYKVARNSRKIVSTITKLPNDSKLKLLLAQTPKNYAIPVKLISDTIMSDSTWTTKALSQVVRSNKLLDIVYTGTSPAITSTMEYMNNYWRNMLMAYNKYPITDSCHIETSQVLLSNANIPNAIPFEFVKYPLFSYQFYHFSYNGSSFLCPAEDYKDLKSTGGSVYQKRNAYPEDEIINALHARTINFNHYFSKKRNHKL